VPEQDRPDEIMDAIQPARGLFPFGPAGPLVERCQGGREADASFEQRQDGQHQGDRDGERRGENHRIDEGESAPSPDTGGTWVATVFPNVAPIHRGWQFGPLPHRTLLLNRLCTSAPFCTRADRAAPEDNLRNSWRIVLEVIPLV